MYSHIIVGFDDSEGGKDAVALGRLLADRTGAELAIEADKGVDLLGMGSRKHGPLSRVLLGSVSGGVVKDAPCPVLVVPRGHVETSDDATPVGAATGAA